MPPCARPSGSPPVFYCCSCAAGAQARTRAAAACRSPSPWPISRRPPVCRAPIPPRFRSTSSGSPLRRPTARPTQLAGRRAAIQRALETGGDSGDRLPLPLSPRTWRARVLRADVADDRLAAAIFGRRATALLYHGAAGARSGDAGVDRGQSRHRSTSCLKHPGATAAFARSIHIRGGVGRHARATRRTRCGRRSSARIRETRRPSSRKLIASRDGRVAAFYDAVTHLDAAHQRFALGAPAIRSGSATRASWSTR